MPEPQEPDASGEWTADDLKGADVHPQAPGDDTEDGGQ